MNTIIGVTALVFVISMVQFIEGQAVTGGCTCQAVDSEITTVILHDFGIVKQCTTAAECGCNLVADVNVRTCRIVCEQVVENWVLNDCPMMLQGREVRAQFQSPSCPNAVGVLTRDCGLRQCLCPCPRPVVFGNMQLQPMQQMQAMQMQPMQMQAMQAFGGGNFLDN